MIYKEFGKTGKKVSALGMGLTRFPPQLYNTEKGMDQCADLIVKAWENGINYFDTAPTYCGGKSEEILGIAIKKIKVSPYISNKSSSTVDATASQLRRRLDISLRRMNVSKVAFYNMWGVLNYQQYQEIIRPGGPYEGALAAQKEGLIEHICISAHCTGEEIEMILKDGLFEGITIGYNAINFKFREKGLQSARKQGIGVAIMNPLNGGVIPQNPNRFSYIKNEENQTLAQAGLLFNASQEGVSVVLSGISNEAELVENVEAFKEKKIFPVSKVEEIKNRIETEFDILCTGCNYCNGCPKSIKINQLMLSYNQYMLSDYNEAVFRDYMHIVWRYNPEDIFECIGCGNCEKKCTQHLNIIERIKEINRLSEQYIKNMMPRLKDYFNLPKDSKLGIYASGPYAKRIFDIYLSREKINYQLYFFDSDKNKWGKSAVIDKYIVYPPKKILEFGIQKILVASSAYYNEIRRFLEEEMHLDVEIKLLDINL